MTTPPHTTATTTPHTDSSRAQETIEARDALVHLGVYSATVALALADLIIKGACR